MPSSPEIYYTTSGKGLPLILLHGYCETHHMWDSFQKELSASYTVICPDLPGFGKSILRSNDFSLSDIADILANWIKGLGIQPCILIGHSLGGYISLALAKENPTLLRGLGLFHSSAFGDDDEKKIARNKTIKFIQNVGAGKFVDSFFPSLFHPENLEKSSVIKAIASLSKNGHKLDTNHVINYMSAMRDRPASLDVLRSFKKPILFISGENDSRTPLKNSIEQAEIPSEATSFILKNTGHMGMFEKEEMTINMVKDFSSTAVPAMDF